MPTQYTRTIRDVNCHNFRSTTTNKIARQTTLPLPIAGSLMAIKSGSLYNLFYADGVTWFKLTGAGSPAAGLPGVLVINNTTGGRDISVTSGDDIAGAAELDLTSVTTMSLTSGAGMSLTSGAAMSLTSAATMAISSTGIMAVSTAAAMALTATTSIALGVSAGFMSLSSSGAMTLTSTTGTMALLSDLGMTLTSTTGTMALLSDLGMSLTSTTGTMGLTSAGVMTLTSSAAAANSIDLLATGTRGFTRISATMDPSVEDPVLEIRGGATGRGSHLRSTQVTAPVVSDDGVFFTGSVLNVGTDMAGTITFTDSAAGRGTITLDFNQDYATPPMVVTTYTLPNSNLSDTFVNGFVDRFEFEATGVGGSAVNQFYYMIIEV